MHPPSIETKQGFIQADFQLLVVADFTSNTTGGSPPLTVRFSDTSTGSPTGWQWDLDGDSVIDSTLQNPSFTYNQGGGYNVSLTASNACGADTETKQNYIFIVGNDDCSGAMPVTFGQNGPFQNSAATTSAPAWPCASGGNDLWFSFTPTCTMNVTVDTCGSGFDTCLEIFDGSCSLLNSLGCNDDDIACGLQSSLDLSPAVGGTTYYIRVGGYNGATGTFVLNLTVGGSGTFSTVSTGCGQATLDPNGSPNVGGGITYTMNNVQGTPLIWIGTIALNNPLCPAGCALGTTFDIIIPARSLGGPIPCMPFLQGAVFYTQGADLNAPGGCMPPIVPLPMTFTDTIVTTIG
jgi:PKD repeat protein